MNKLEECRAKIDELDSKIAQLYEFRMSIVKEVIKYKIEEDLPIFDQNRELEMLKSNVAKIQNEEYRTYYKPVLNGFTEASRLMQEDILEHYRKK